MPEIFMQIFGEKNCTGMLVKKLITLNQYLNFFSMVEKTLDYYTSKRPVISLNQDENSFTLVEENFAIYKNSKRPEN